MSKTTKWVVGIIIIVLVVLGLWWSGILGGGSSQSAAALNALDASIAADGSSFDGQMTGIQADVTGFNKNLSQGSITAAAAHIQAAATGLTKLGTKVQARLASGNVNANTAASVNAALADMSQNLSNATSLAGTAAANAKALKTATSTAASTTVSGNFVAGLQAAKGQILAAQQDLVNARKDAQTIMQLLSSTGTAPVTATSTARPTTH